MEAFQNQFRQVGIDNKASADWQIDSTNTAKERFHDNLSTHFVPGYAPAALTSETQAIFKGKKKDDKTGLKRKDEMKLMEFG